ncbi:hypothetical protein [Streptomyces sp. Ncost-T10-10d]|uniref:hypothetical protein n=1 Tax=Streptomyces sp. Ncost-T10-10d TaxID=1839774 RepID=UPI000B844482|nr:hypothetical protein [Streptomyces sp. Ncost-T10-10d]
MGERPVRRAQMRSSGGSGPVLAGLVAVDDDTDTGQVAALDPSGEDRGPFDEGAGDGRFGGAIAAARPGRTVALINNRPSPRNRLPVPGICGRAWRSGTPHGPPCSPSTYPGRVRTPYICARPRPSCRHD